MTITNDIKYIGVNDHQIDLFEGNYAVPNGMAYNSYAILDEKIAILDTMEKNFTQAWLDNIRRILGGRRPHYLVVQHMEPDHSASIAAFLGVYPEAVVVSSAKAFHMMKNFFGTDLAGRRLVVDDGDTLDLGKHQLTFLTAPMVHWPEVIVTYDARDKVLFSADGFGKFGTLDTQEDWAPEARRYYFGILGKYGAQVQNLLKKTAQLDIRIICPLHGPILSQGLEHCLRLYDLWSSYAAESEGVVIAYTSVYGSTKTAVELLAQKLRENGCPAVAVFDLARCDMSRAVESAFRYSKLVLATTTYNADIFPAMKTFLHHLTERSFQNRTVALMENGSWAPLAARTMKQILEGSKALTFTGTTVRILSALSGDSRNQVDALAAELSRDYLAQRDTTAIKKDPTALFKMVYGLYVVTSREGSKDNGILVNTVFQLTNTPNRIGVNLSKETYSHDIIQRTGVLNVNCLDDSAPFSLLQVFGFQSGRTTDKFAGIHQLRSGNGLRFLPRYINAFLSLQVEHYVDLGTHGLFICSVTEARVISNRDTMTYAYYQNNVKPKPQTQGKKGYVCKVCGWVYEGDPLPEDIVCPLCKHGYADFEPLP